MIGLIRGQVFSNRDGSCLVMVGVSGSGVGYEIRVPVSSRYSQLAVGTIAEFFIHTHVREDSLELFGFLSSEEKELFLTLLAVSGVGPRLALLFLSSGSLESLIQAIITGDIAFLTEIPGVGRKTAERIVLEVSDNIKKKLKSGKLAAPSTSSQSQRLNVPAREDAKLALVGLGYREIEAEGLLESAARLFDSGAAETVRVEEWIRKALRQAQQL